MLRGPCSIPPEWSHWLNYMSDDIPSKGDMSGERPMYFVTREAFVTGERPYMLPKGSWLNPEKVGQHEGTPANSYMIQCSTATSRLTNSDDSCFIWELMLFS